MSKSYKTIQVDSDIHEQFKEYCDKRGLPLGKFTEGLFLCALSGSISGSDIAKVAFQDDHDTAVKHGNY